MLRAAPRALPNPSPWLVALACKCPLIPENAAIGADALQTKKQEDAMSRKLGAGWVALGAVLWGLSAAAKAATVGVTVVGGAVVASPLGVTLAPTEDSLVFQLGTPGYTFSLTGAVVITGTGSSFRCVTAGSRTTVTCKKSGQGNNSQQTYQISVLPAGSKTPLDSPPDLWIVSE